MLRTRGMPMRSCAALFHERDAAAGGGGPCACAGGNWHRPRFPGGASAILRAPPVSTRFGLAALVASSWALMPRMVSTSSTAPFSQVATIMRCSPGWSGTLVMKEVEIDGGASPAANPLAPSSSLRASSVRTSSVRTSRKVRRQAFLQKLQRVSSLCVVR